MKHCLGILTGAALIGVFFCGSASAEHEADHRYTIRGYVLDENETAIPNVTVMVRLGDRLLGRARADSQGYYSVRTHLHDSDIGTQLSVRAGTRAATIEMTAGRGDLSTNRVHYLNFVGAKVIEGKLGGWHFPAWTYVAAGSLAGLIATAWVVRRVRKFARHRRPPTTRRRRPHRPKRSGKRKRR